MRSRTSSGFAYRAKIPSRFRTASPPRRPISIASLGPTTPSMAAAMIGSSNRWPSSSQAMRDALDRARDTSDEPGEAAGPDHLWAPAHLRAHPVDQAVHEPGEAVDRARLDIGRRVSADRFLGPDELDPVEAGRAVHERVDRRPQAGRDRAADELALRVHAVEGRRGAEIDDDDGRPIQNARRERV